MASAQDSVRYELPSGDYSIDRPALELMKQALQAFIGSPALPPRFLELRESFLAELGPSATWIRGREAGIGAWKLENRDGRLTLVHYPPPARGPAYLYHATLAKRDGAWTVASFEQEREFGPM
jgi:hypothetical protein